MFRMSRNARSLPLDMTTNFLKPSFCSTVMYSEIRCASLMPSPRYRPGPMLQALAALAAHLMPGPFPQSPNVSHGPAIRQDPGREIEEQGEGLVPVWGSHFDSLELKNVLRTSSVTASAIALPSISLAPAGSIFVHVSKGQRRFTLRSLPLSVNLM